MSPSWTRANRTTTAWTTCEEPRCALERTPFCPFSLVIELSWLLSN